MKERPDWTKERAAERGAAPADSQVSMLGRMCVFR